MEREAFEQYRDMIADESLAQKEKDAEFFRSSLYYPNLKGSCFGLTYRFFV